MTFCQKFRTENILDKIFAFIHVTYRLVHIGQIWKPSRREKYNCIILRKFSYQKLTALLGNVIHRHNVGRACANGSPLVSLL